MRFAYTFAHLLLVLSSSASAQQRPPLPPPPASEIRSGHPDESAIYDFVEVSPELIGGLNALQQSVVYPDADRRAGNEGRVMLRFVISEKGLPYDVHVVRGVSPGLDAAAIRAVQQARFTPGQQNGRAVAVRFTLPVLFRITAPMLPPGRP
jgi:TonB family protein